MKETNSDIIVIGITPCSNHVENILKGSLDKITEASLGIKAICEQISCRVRYLDVGSFINENDMNYLVPDGIHFSAEGHRKLVSRLT